MKKKVTKKKKKMSHKFLNLFTYETLAYGHEHAVFENVTFLREFGRIKAGTKLEYASISLQFCGFDKENDLIEDVTIDLMKDMITE